MTSLAHFQNHLVEILDTFECGGIELAAVRALAGKPFVGGDKWPIQTEFATVRASELSEALPVSIPAHIMAVTL